MEKKWKRKEKEKERKTNLTILTRLLHYYTLLMKEFLLFSTIPISIETVTLIRTTIAIHLIIPFAIHAFEGMRAWLAFFGGRSICFFVLHATPCFLSVVFGSMSSIAFSTPGDMRATTECQMTPLPTVLALRNTWVRVGTLNGSDVIFYIEIMVDNVLSCKTTLEISDVHPNHCLIGFRGCFNNTRF